jgi:hypothetical protein
MIYKPKFHNGHHDQSQDGDCLYRGPLEHLPPPHSIWSAEEAAEAMFSEGFVQFPDLLGSQEVHDVRKWIDSLLKPDEEYVPGDAGFNEQLMIDLQHDPMWLSLIDRPPAFEALELILGSRFVVTGGSVWVTGQGGEMPIHVDRLSIELPEEILRDERVRIPIFTCTLQYYLDDQVEEIGPMLVIPGSHHAGRIPQDESTWHGITPKMVSLRAGGALLFRHDLWHGAAKNGGPRRRYMIQIHYAEKSRNTAGPAITRPECFSPEVLASVTPRQRVLMGEGANGIFNP